jgi:hypothetical protein
LVETPAKLEAKRIRQVQNLNGIKFSNIEKFHEKLQFLEAKLEFLEKDEEPDVKEIRHLKYNIKAVKNVLDGNVKVYNYRQFNECRLYSTLTSLPKDLRKYIYSDYGYFYELDIKASQPRLVKKCFTILLGNFTIDNYFYKLVNTPNYDKNNINDEMRLEFENWKISLIDELDRFNELTSDDFYLEVASDPIFRDEMKKQFMWYFFDYSKKIDNGYYFHKYMIDNFPNIEKFKNALNLCKSYFKYKSNLYDIPANFSKVEAEIVLETICKRFVKANPDSSIFTIHDGISVNLKDLQQIVDLTTQAYAEAGVYLNFKLTCLGTGETLAAQPPIYGGLVYREYKDSIDSREYKDSIDSREYKDSHRINRNPPYIGGCEGSLAAQTRNTPSRITLLKDGRFQISIKDRKIKSRKNETLDEFKTRLTFMLC